MRKIASDFRKPLAEVWRRRFGGGLTNSVNGFKVVPQFDNEKLKFEK